jgi:hypothetical protein
MFILQVTGEDPGATVVEILGTGVASEDRGVDLVGDLSNHQAIMVKVL